jgi:hypothetical protein
MVSEPKRDNENGEQKQQHVLHLDLTLLSALRTVSSFTPQRSSIIWRDSRFRVVALKNFLAPEIPE